MEFMLELREIVQKAVAKHKAVEPATKEAHRVAKKLPGYKEWTEHLAEMAIRGMVGDRRHSSTMQTKKEAGIYTKPPKVKVTDSKAVREITKSMYDTFYIAGTVLGDILGKDIERVAEGEFARGNGYHANARLLMQLKPLVPADKMIRQCVAEKRIKAIWRSVKESLGGFSEAG